MVEVFSLNILISLLALTIVLYIAQTVWNHCYPPPRNWIEFDCWDGGKSFLAHLMDCGLIYPAIYLYVWVGIYSFVEWVKVTGF